MKARMIVSGVLLLFVAASITAIVIKNTEDGTTSSATTIENLDGKVVVYYFHRTQRCPTCLKIEELASDVVQARFAAELTAGKLIWKTVNIDSPGNGHFEGDFNLITQSLIVVDNRETGQSHWWNLDKIWELVWMESDFRMYVDTEIRKILDRA